jgi:two-component system KDP operon response regulator KdpE
MHAPPLVLIVEDDPTLVHAIERNLAARGYATRVASTVAGALSMLAARAPDLLLLDIDLPDGSGWEIIRRARENGAARMALVVMSALRPNARLVADYVVAGVLEKPFPMDSLLRLVARHTGGSVSEPLLESQVDDAL